MQSGMQLAFCFCSRESDAPKHNLCGIVYSTSHTVYEGMSRDVHIDF